MLTNNLLPFMMDSQGAVVSTETVGSGGSGGTNTTTITSFTVTDANLILVGVRVNLSNDQTDVSITRDGQSFTLVDYQTFDTNKQMAIYKLLSPNTGSTDLVVTTTNTDYTRVIAVGLKNFSSLGTIAKDYDDTDTDTTPTVDATTVVDDLVIDFLGTENNVTFTDDEGQELATVTSRLAASYEVATTTSTTTSWTISPADKWGIVSIPIRS